MDEYIVMADETIIKNSYVIQIDPDMIAIWLTNDYTIQEIADAFGDPKKTIHMVSHQGVNHWEWDGFIQISTIQIFETQSCICLTKEA